MRRCDGNGRDRCRAWVVLGCVQRGARCWARFGARQGAQWRPVLDQCSVGGAAWRGAGRSRRARGAEGGRWWRTARPRRGGAPPSPLPPGRLRPCPGLQVRRRGAARALRPRARPLIATRGQCAPSNPVGNGRHIGGLHRRPYACAPAAAAAAAPAGRSQKASSSPLPPRPWGASRRRSAAVGPAGMMPLGVVAEVGGGCARARAGIGIERQRRQNWGWEIGC
jgi:hypothetical protein